jgi:hypothetical protein
MPGGVAGDLRDYLRPLCRLVRPAWALSSGCKSRRKETILIEANRNCASLTFREEQGESESTSRRAKNQIRGCGLWGEQGCNREAPTVMAQAGQIWRS